MRKVFAIIIAAIAMAAVLAAPGCAGGGAEPSLTPSAAGPAAPSPAGTPADIEMYRPVFFSGKDIAEFHINHLVSFMYPGLPLTFKCEGCEAELKTSAGRITDRRKQESSGGKEWRSINDPEHDYVYWVPFTDEENQELRLADIAEITFTVYEEGRAKARGVIEVVKTAENEGSVAYNVSLSFLELCR